MELTEVKVKTGNPTLNQKRNYCKVMKERLVKIHE